MIFENKNPIMWEDLIFRDRVNYKLTLNIDKPVNGFDTETLRGFCKLITDHNGRTLIDGDLDQILDFMTHGRYRNCHNFFYNVKFDAQGIIKYLPEDQIKEIYQTTKTKYGPYSLKYIPKKLFSIQHNRHVHKFYDLAQFYECSLDKASKDYLGVGKQLNGLSREKIGLSQLYWENNRDDIIKYCIVDSQLCGRLGVQLHNTFRDTLNITPRQYFSQAGCSKDYFMLNSNIPDIKEVPKWALSMAFNAYSGGRFEVPRKGYIGQCHGIDINSAYPSAIANLVDITHGDWKQVDEPNAEALLGYYFVKVFIPQMPLGPLPVNHTSNTKIYPIGEFTTFINKAELEALEGIMDIEVYYGVEFYDKEPIYPFRAAVEALYAIKRTLPKEGYAYALVKKMLNSSYGWQYEKRRFKDKVLATLVKEVKKSIAKKKKKKPKWVTGKFFNPVNSTEITTDCRLTMWDVIKRQPKEVVSIATDGMLLTKEPDIEFSTDMGRWDRDSSGDTTIIRCGVAKVGDKIKNRGLTKMELIETPYGKYKHIFDYIEQQPQLLEYEVLRHRPLGLGECVTHVHKRHVKQINYFVDDPYTITLNRDFKRVWDDEFVNGADFLDREINSQPQVLL